MLVIVFAFTFKITCIIVLAFAWLLPVHDATQWLESRPFLPPIVAGHLSGKQAALYLQGSKRVEQGDRKGAG